MADLPLTGRVALVTGASRGIGRATALELARAGADVVVVGYSDSSADRTAGEIQALGRASLALRADVASAQECEGLVSAATARFGRVDILVNNAGMVSRQAISEATDSQFERVLAVNLAGPFYLARRLIPKMVAQGYGRVVNVSSISGTLGTPRLSAYCASKWGLNGLTKALAEELKGTGVMVTAILPGSVDTDMLKGSGFAPAMTAEQVAVAIRFLCAQAPQAMTGTLLEMFG